MIDTRWAILVTMGLLILSGTASLTALRLTRWPKAQKAALRIGDALLTFVLGLIGYCTVVIVLRALGWLPLN